MTKWKWFFKKLFSKLWFRSALYCLAGFLTVVFAAVFGRFIPYSLYESLNVDAVETILKIIASSMLAVTTFSLSTMVSAHTAAASHATPRSTKLLLEDDIAQNALSTFIGSFLYSLVGIVALHTGFYNDSGLLILFASTVVVIVLIIFVLIQWINYLSTLGRVGQTIESVERAAKLAFSDRLKSPNLGGKPLGEFEPQDNHVPVCENDIGYIQYIDVEKLNALASEGGFEVYVIALPGRFNDGQSPVAYLSKELEDEGCLEDVQGCFGVDRSRSFEQDPRFSLIVLSEIASRALSPGVNDPGTAIEVIGSAVRVMSFWLASSPQSDEVKYESVHVPSLSVSDLFDDIFSPIARDGAAFIEVDIRLQKALRSLHEIECEACKDAAKQYSQKSYQLAGDALKLDDDKQRLKALLIS